MMSAMFLSDCLTGYLAISQANLVKYVDKSAANRNNNYHLPRLSPPNFYRMVEGKSWRAMLSQNFYWGLIKVTREWHILSHSLNRPTIIMAMHIRPYSWTFLTTRPQDRPWEAPLSYWETLERKLHVLLVKREFNCACRSHLAIIQETDYFSENSWAILIVLVIRCMTNYRKLSSNCKVGSWRGNSYRYSGAKMFNAYCQGNPVQKF